MPRRDPAPCDRGMACGDVGSEDIVSFARTISTVTGLANPGPSTVNNYLSHLASVFAVAKKAWGYPLDPEAMSDALFVLRKQKAIAKWNKRDRRPTLDELDRLLAFFRGAVGTRAALGADGRHHPVRDCSRPGAWKRSRAFGGRTSSRDGQAPCPRSCPRHEEPRRQEGQRCLVRIAAGGGGGH